MRCVISEYNNYNNALSWGAHCAHLWLVCDITTLRQSYFTNTNTTRDNAIYSCQLTGQEIQDRSFTVSTKADHVTQSTEWKHWRKQSTDQNQWNHHLTSPCLHPPPDSGLELDVDCVKLFQLTEIFPQRFDGVAIYFFNSNFKFFDDASEFSVASL